MKAQNLTISVPYKGCDKNCSYCVSKMTGYPQPNLSLMYANIEKVKTVARSASVSSVLFTSKGEPFMNQNDLLKLLKEFREWPIEIQTNGLVLERAFRVGMMVGKAEMSIFDDLVRNRVNVLAFSVDDWKTLLDYSEMFEFLQEKGILVRVTLNIVKEMGTSLDSVVEICHECFVNQLSFRQITIPAIMCDSEQAKTTAKWIRKHAKPEHYNALKQDIFQKLSSEGHLLMTLPYGVRVYDYKGLSITYFDECVQETNNGDDIRSLIFQEDGHLYTSWSSKASKLF